MKKERRKLKKMPNTKDIKLTHLKVLVWGEAFSGKTTFASTFPRPFFFDLDNKMSSLAGKDIEYETYTGAKGYRKFRIDLPKIAERDDIDTLVVDGLSSMHSFLMDEIMMLSEETKSGLPEIKHYHIQIIKLQKFFYELILYPKHIVLTAHEQIFQDEVTKEVFVLPLVVGSKLPQRLGNWFTEFYHMESVNTKEGLRYKIRTRKSRRYSCGSCIGNLDELEEPDFNVIMAKAKKGGKM